MRSVDARTADWIDVAADLLAVTRSSTEFTALIAEQLLDTFDSGVVTVSVRDDAGRLTQAGWSRDSVAFGGMPLRQTLDALHPVLEGGNLNHQPAVAFQAATRTLQPMILSRVPRMFHRTAEAQHVMEVLRALDVAQQLSLPAEFSGLRHRVFVVQRPASGDYSAEDLAVAARIQPLLIAVHRQVAVVDSFSLKVAGMAGLTGRELAVLTCVAEGLTSGAIAAKLMISPRTAEKHAENAYRKLGVNDRVTAVLAAKEAGILA